MKGVKFSPESVFTIQQYVRRYRSYYQELYEDSGIWAENQIIEGYEKESIERYDEIFETISRSLSNEAVSYLVNTTIIRWRSKILFINFEDEGDTRVVTHLEIR